MNTPHLHRSFAEHSSEHLPMGSARADKLSTRVGFGLLLTSSYFLFGKLGLLLAIPPGYATAIWPSSGIALAGLLLLGIRYWPAIFIGSLSANLISIADNSTAQATLLSIVIASSISVGATLQAVLAAKWVWRHTQGSLLLARERDIFGFYVLGGPIAHLLGAVIGAGTLYVSGLIPLAALIDNAWTWWIGNTIGALIFAPLIIMWLGPTQDWASRRAIVSVPLLTMFVAALVAFAYANRAEWRDLRQHLADDASDVGQTIAKRIDVDVELLHAFGTYLQVDADIDHDTFARFSDGIMTAHDEIISLQWALAVDQANRAGFESAMRRGGFDNFVIWDVQPNTTAAERAVYLPIQLVAGGDNNIGKDLRSPANAEMEHVINSAIVDHDIRATPISLTTDHNVTEGLLLALPVFDSHHYIKIDPNNGTRNTAVSSHLRGVVVATISTAKLVSAATHDRTLLTHASLTITDNAPGTNRSRQIITFHSTPSGLVGGKSMEHQSRRSDVDFSMDIRAADRVWTLQFNPTLEYQAQHKASAGWLVLAGGLMFTALIGAGALLITGRGLSIETLVSQRTKELAHINETLADEICDHLNTEHALDKERESLKAVLNNLHEGILVFDTIGQLRIANGAALKMHRSITGTELDFIRGPTAFGVFAADGKTPITSHELPQAYALRGETVRDFEIVAQTPGRDALCLSVNAQPLFTSDGKQHGAIVVVRNITDSRQIERLKTEFVATVSHELRTPITSIRGSLGLLAGGAAGQLNDKVQHLVEIALRNSDRLALLINDLLDIEKIESGNMRFNLEQHSLRELIDQSMEANAGYAQSFNANLILIGTIPSVQINVDADRLLQVLANLLSNAAKFSPAGASVDISAHTFSHHDVDIVRVCIRDHGPGIAEDFRSRLFQKFSQADASDARSKSGTGLGLAICKSIIERLGGSIGYETELGTGTTFYFDLPTSPSTTTPTQIVERAC